MAAGDLGLERAFEAMLDEIEQRHVLEEKAEAGRWLAEEPRPLRILRPIDGRLPKSEQWLERLYAHDRHPREKKPGVFDHLRSVGPWFVSIDDDPMSVLDAMSQTATVCGGFAEDPVVRAYTEGEFGDAVLFAHDVDSESGYTKRFADQLRKLVPGLPHVTFTNSGAEGCEKALALCYAQRRSDAQRHVLAFEGSFHGRTLLALHASYSPEKRTPFEIAGYEVTFAPFPLWDEPEQEPSEPPGFLSRVASRDFDFENVDALLQKEIDTLKRLDSWLSKGEFFAVIIEPMQSEGGDRYATARFYRALRVLTRQHQVPLIFDEVQTGFGLGGAFAWHCRFGLAQTDGTLDAPDCVVFAKRAQVGVVMSRFADTEPTSAHAASMVRGWIHANMMENNSHARQVQQMVRERARALAQDYPELVLHPRATGYAFAFDLPSADVLQTYLAQRFWRGAIVFGAGNRTVRYRLSSGFGHAEIDQLFEIIRASLEWIKVNTGKEAPAWFNLERARTSKVTEEPEVRVRTVERNESSTILEGIVALEARVYEPARRDPIERLRLAFEDKGGIALIAEVKEEQGWQIGGYALAAPIESVDALDGPDRDPMRGKQNTLYSIAISVDPRFRGLGIGRLLKRAQIVAAREKKTSNGEPRFLFISGRSRVGHAEEMRRINKSFGAHEVFLLEHQYGEADAQAIYYRLPVHAFSVVNVHRESTVNDANAMDMAHGTTKPFANAPKSLEALLHTGALYGPAVNKITLCNYVTPAIIRSMEWVSALTPNMPHLYLTSSRDEAFDKSLRVLRWHRKEGRIVIGLEGGYVGHTTAAARSLSDEHVHRQGSGYFREWKRLPHPSLGLENFERALRETVEQAGGAHKILGFVFEPLQERTGLTISDSLWNELTRLRSEFDIPVVAAETASAYYRSGRGPFFTSNANFSPDLLIWWAGGQVGFVHSTSRYYVKNPLAMVSTWDGDELSLIRAHHQLRAARHVDISTQASAFEHALSPLAKNGLSVRGAGLYRTVHVGEKSKEFVQRLHRENIHVQSFANGYVAFVPSLDTSSKEWTRLQRILEEISCENI